MEFLSHLKSFATFKKRDIFAYEISGYEEEKWFLTQALNNNEPTHILLVGPPGIGKTRFLKYGERLVTL
jgi:Cdc6-like AAA superfamily ATPase